MRTYNILSIDAWGDSAICTECGESLPEDLLCECGQQNDDTCYTWSWNNWHKIDTVELSNSELNDESAILKLLVSEYLNGPVSNYVLVDDQYNLVVQLKSNNMPIIVLEYGNHDQE